MFELFLAGLIWCVAGYLSFMAYLIMKSRYPDPFRVSRLAVILSGPLVWDMVTSNKEDFEIR